MKVMISSHELEVLRKSADGLTVQEISTELNLSEDLIARLQKRLLLKTRANTLFNALHVVARNGFLLREENNDR